MSRITGNDAKGLMEAYGAVYQPKHSQKNRYGKKLRSGLIHL
jgi:hypothetical protein